MCICNLAGMRTSLLTKRQELTEKRAELVHEALLNHSPLYDLADATDLAGPAKRPKVRAGATAWWHTLRHQAAREGWPRP